MYPFRFEPIYQHYIWGGERIFAHFPRKRPQGKGPFAESWEISDRKEAMSIVANGPLQGTSLSSLIREFGKNLLGTKVETALFPLLLKIIDAKENLSVQVHPDAAKAKEFQGEPKTESWIALEPSSVFAGLKEGVSQEIFSQAIREGTAEKYLHFLSLKKGEALFLPARRVHAICKGSFLFEVQQNSNTTYRLYDWGRKGRELHLKEGLSTIDWTDFAPEPAKPKAAVNIEDARVKEVIRSSFFTIEKIELQGRWKVLPRKESFEILFVSKGEGKIIASSLEEALQAGTTYLVPASIAVELQGDLELYRIFL